MCAAFANADAAYKNAKRTFPETAICGLFFWTVHDLKNKPDSVYFGAPKDANWEKPWYKLYVYETKHGIRSEIGYTTQRNVQKATKYKTLWWNQVVAKLPDIASKPVQTAAAKFDFYSQPLEAEFTFEDAEKAIQLRFQAYEWVTKTEKKRSALEAGTPLFDFVYLQNTQSLDLDRLSFHYTQWAAAYVGYASKDHELLVEFRAQWKRAELDLLWHRLNTCLAGDPESLMKQSRLDFPIYTLQADSKEMTDADDLLDMKLRQLDSSVQKWLYGPFEDFVYEVGHRQAVLHLGQAFVPLTQLAGYIKSAFKKKLSAFLDTEQRRQPEAFADEQTRTLMAYYYKASRQLYSVQAGGIYGDTKLPGGLSAMATLLRGTGIPPCILQMRNTKHLKNDRRMVFANFMFRMGARPKEVLIHWNAGFRSHFWKEKGATSKSVDSEMKKIEFSLIKGHKERNKYQYSCFKMIKEPPGKNPDGVCPVMQQHSLDGTRIATCLATCQRQMLGTDEIVVPLRVQSPVLLFEAFLQRQK